MFLTEFEQTAINVKKTIERIPDDKFGWKPHEKSFSMGDLASHLAEIQSWINVTINTDKFDMNPKDGEEYVPLKAENKKQLLEKFDKYFEEGKKSLSEADDLKLDGNWSLLSAGNSLFTMPKKAVLRNLVLNHLVHHNAQLGVYLRLNDVPVPAIYGPSADEESM